MSTGILFLINPVSGGRTGTSLKNTLDGLIEELALKGSCETAFTSADGSFAASRNLDGYETVIAAGGDGTVAGIVRQLAGFEKKPRLGIIPCGTGNDLARVSGAFGYRRKHGLAALVQALITGAARPLDVFSVNEKLYFTNYCGIGLDARISNDFNLRRNSPLVRAAARVLGGRSAYPWFALRNLPYRMQFPLELSYTAGDGRPRLRKVGQGARQVLVTNISSYAAGAYPAPRCASDDGLFEVTVIETLRQWFVLHMTRFVRLTLPAAVQFRASELRASFSGSTCFQADGELYADVSSGGRGLHIRPAARIELIYV